MKIVWSLEARADLLSIFTYIAEQDFEAAMRQKSLVINSIAKLSEMPNIGRAGRLPDTRELVIPSTKFLVPYRVHSEQVQILRVFHSSQNWKK